LTRGFAVPETKRGAVKLMGASSEMSRQTLSSLLFFCSILLTVGAAVTLLPSSSLMISDLGYHTFCPFAPWSTITLLFLAGLAWMIRKHVDSQPV
jgi:hypothetical protein